MTNRDSGVALVSEENDSFESDDENLNSLLQDNDQRSREIMSAEELERLTKIMAHLAPCIPMFKNDPLAKIDIKAKDLDRQVSNFNRRFKAWKDMIVIPDVPKKVWLGVWKGALSDEALDVLEKVTYAATDDQEDYETVAQKLLDYLTNKRGSKYTARVQFRSLKQSDKEQFSTFYQRLQSAAAPCRWTEEVRKENMIEQLISGHRDERVRAILFDMDSDDLEKYVRKCEALEIATLQAAQINQPSTSGASLPVNSAHARGHPYQRGFQRGRGNFPRGRGFPFRRGNGHQHNQGRCGWCGGQEHGANNSERTTYCKARNYICQSCGCKGHYERCCRNSAAAAPGQPKPQPPTNTNNNNGNRPNCYQRHLGQTQQQQTDHVQANYENELLYDYADGEEESHAITDEELHTLERSCMTPPPPVDQVSSNRRDFLKNL